MIIVQVDKNGDLIKQAAKELGEFGDKAPQVVVAAINATGRNVTTMLKKYVRQTYTYSRSDKLKKAFSEPTKATKARMQYTINTVSKEPHLSEFKISPKEPPAATVHMAAKAQVLKQGSMKTIGTDPLKAFIARFAHSNGNDKVAVVQRVPGKTYTVGAEQRRAKWGNGADMTKLKAFFGPRITSMTGKVYADQAVQKEVGDLLQTNLRKQIDKVIQRMSQK